MAEFVPFPEPKQTSDMPLVSHAGMAYACNGCGGPVPDGVWLYEDVDGGQVVGIVARLGVDGQVVHACGTKAGLAGQGGG